MEKLYIIKIGGNTIDNEPRLNSFLEQFAAIKEKKILVHGGGKLATRLTEAMGIKQQLIDGRRITDAETLKVVTMVYAGYINKNIVAKLQAINCNAMGLTGADANLVIARKRNNSEIDYGFVGDIDFINAGVLKEFIDQGITPVFCSITHNKNGTLLNTNADTIAQEIAKAISHIFSTSLVYCFEYNGVLKNVNDSNSVITKISSDYLNELKIRNIISAGMIPKLDNAFAALQSGVESIVLGNAVNLQQLINHKSGTTISHE